LRQLSLKPDPEDPLDGHRYHPNYG
jgi:hypothetical protein